jgi:hypothetical protein
MKELNRKVASDTRTNKSHDRCLGTGLLVLGKSEGPLGLKSGANLEKIVDRIGYYKAMHIN